MDEKEKMLKGQIYDPNTEILIKERQNCKTLCQEYNNIPCQNMEERNALLTRLLGQTGKNFLVEQPFLCDYGYNIKIGENFYANHNLIILDPGSVEFGENVFIGPNCAFYTPLHPLDFKTRNQGLEYSKPIKVGNNVWFGGNVTVIGGITIGNNSVIGAGSVVTKDIPENVVVAGNPAKIIKNINND